MDFRFSLVLIGFLAVAFTVLVQQRCKGQMVPNAPVRDFSLPRFGDNGYKIWSLSGTEGHYISPERIDVIDMSLRLFSGDEWGAVEMQIVSPQASLFIQQNHARSSEKILVEGKSYRVEGRDWAWDGNQKKVIVQKDVHAIFNETLSILLIP